MNKYYLTFGWGQTSYLYEDKGTKIKDYYIIILAESERDADQFAKEKFNGVYSRVISESQFSPEYFPLGLLDILTTY